MKKQYSLDYEIERDVDRLHAVEKILDNLEKKPSNADLEQMASYILYGKNEEGKNAVHRKEITDDNRRYSSFRRKSEKTQSLDAILENPLADQNFQDIAERNRTVRGRTTIRRPKGDDPGDSDIPGMVELWESIDALEHTIAVAEGKLAPNPDTPIITQNYRLYQLRHQLIDLRRHQYYLKDFYKPTIHFLNLHQPSPQTYNFDEDAFYWLSLDEWREKTSNCVRRLNLSQNLEDYETRIDEDGNTQVKWMVRQQTFDWENPHHIKILIDHYSSLYQQVWDKPYSWGRTLLFDFDRYYDMCGFSEVRDYIITRRIDRAPYLTIQKELAELYGLHYNENHVGAIATEEVPAKMALAAKKARLLVETPPNKRKECWTCKRKFPADVMFFGKNRGRSDGLGSNCKECEKKRRIRRGQSVHDNRCKDPKEVMFKM